MDNYSQFQISFLYFGYYSYNRFHIQSGHERFGSLSVSRQPTISENYILIGKSVLLPTPYWGEM